jgi:Predicted membrane protein (DUF2254)
LLCLTGNPPLIYLKTGSILYLAGKSPLIFPLQGSLIKLKIEESLIEEPYCNRLLPASNRHTAVQPLSLFHLKNIRAKTINSTKERGRGLVKQFLFKIKEGTWFIPAVYTIVALILAIVVVYVDFYLEAFYPEIFLVGLDLGKTILGTIAGSLLTMTTITFSTTMVVLTTYSSQFSPRTLENFIQDPVTMRVLGVFIGGFVYCIFTLLFIRESVGNTVASATIGVIIAFICLAFFAFSSTMSPHPFRSAS